MGINSISSLAMEFEGVTSASRGIHATVIGAKNSVLDSLPTEERNCLPNLMLTRARECLARTSASRNREKERAFQVSCVLVERALEEGGHEAGGRKRKVLRDQGWHNR